MAKTLREGPATTESPGFQEARLRFRQLVQGASIDGFGRDATLMGVAVELVDFMADRYGATLAAGLLRQIAEAIEADGRAATG